MKIDVSYKKLWHLLLDREMNKNNLRELTGLSTSTVAKITKCENINIDVLVKICQALGCNIGDIMDVLPPTEVKESPVG
ncbi:transcriptional regulator [Clostridia bacterium]|nr:transcriptional regulator [Clostridia bacterium]GHV37061.1 transcriptional regulator [Clostridia bacterium]